ncbi:MAG: PQQ-binding-like beta-propeller repeat protein [Dongiaceae bacterium]
MRQRLLIRLVALATIVCASGAAWSQATGTDTAAKITEIWTDSAPLEANGDRQLLAFDIAADGGLIGFGFASAKDFSLETLRLVAVKISPDGRELWRQSLTSNEPLRGSGMAPAPDGGMFVCDGTQNIYRLDSSGQIVWHTITGKWMDLICQGVLYQSHDLLLIAGERRIAAFPDNWRDHEGALTAFDPAAGEQLWQVGYSPFDQLFWSGSTVLATADRLIWFGSGSTEDSPILYKHSFYWSYDVGFDGRVLARTDLVQLFEDDDFAEYRQIIVNDDNQLVLMGRYPGHAGISVMVWNAPDWRNPFEYGYAPEYILEWENETELGAPTIVESTDDKLTTMIVRYPDQDGELAAIGLVTKHLHEYRSFETRTIELSADLPHGPIAWDRRNPQPFESGSHFYVWRPSQDFPSYVPAKVWRIDLE